MLTNPNYQAWETDCECGRHVENPYRPYDEQPWIAQIYENRSNVIIPICLGSLISHHHVLTSKHCFGDVIAGGDEWKLKERSQYMDEEN